MSCFLTDYNFLYSDYVDPILFFDDLFSGKCWLKNLRAPYFPETFPTVFGSIINPCNLEINDNERYLFFLKNRTYAIIDKLFSSFYLKIKDASKFDAVLVIRSHGAAGYDYFRGQLSDSNNVSNKEVIEKVYSCFLKSGVSTFNKENIHIIDAICATGHVVIGLIRKMINLKKWNRVLVIGYDLIFIERLWYLMSVGAAARYPGDQCVIEGPFSKNRCGFIESEVGAIAIFESEKSLRERGVNPKSQILSSFHNSDADTLTAGSENGRQIEICMGELIKNYSVDAIKVHGTGTQVNDENEAAVIARLYKERELPPIISIKGQLGHSLNMSGLFETIVCSEMFLRKQIPAIQNCPEPSTSLKSKLILKNKIFKGKRMLLNAFGFGGYNSSLILEKI